MPGVIVLIVVVFVAVMGGLIVASFEGESVE